MSERIKCVRCKVNLTCDKFKKKRDDTYSKTCIRCLDTSKKYRDTYKCEHGIRKTNCKECDGGSVCTHGKVRTRCKECDGVSFCEHRRIKSNCEIGRAHV